MFYFWKISFLVYAGYFFVLLVDIGGGEEVRKYPHMCSSSLGAKGGGAVIRNGEGEGGGEEGMYVVFVFFCSKENIIFCTF